MSLWTDLLPACSVTSLQERSLQKSALSPFPSCVSVLCHLPGVPGTFCQPGSAQCHCYRYCPTLLSGFWPSILRHLPTGVHITSPEQPAHRVHPGIEQNPAQEPPYCPHRRLFVVATAVPAPANKDIMTRFQSWSCYGISLTPPPRDVSAGSKTDLCWDDLCVAAILFAQILCEDEGISLSEKSTVVYKSHTFANQNLQVLPAT